VRHGTTTLFAALEVATGKVTDTCYDRHRHQEFLRFLKQVAKAYPRRELHIVLDNYGTHKHPAVRAWLTKHPRIQLHFTPTFGSWLNAMEIFFGIITRQAIRRGTFGSVNELTAAIRRFIDGWNDRCEPFTWTKTADGSSKRQNPRNVKKFHSRDTSERRPPSLRRHFAVSHLAETQRRCWGDLAPDGASSSECYAPIATVSSRLSRRQSSGSATQKGGRRRARYAGAQPATP
jgi:transposase